jgi:hypothetical protein
LHPRLTFRKRLPHLWLRRGSYSLAGTWPGGRGTSRACRKLASSDAGCQGNHHRIGAGRNLTRMADSRSLCLLAEWRPQLASIIVESRCDAVSTGLAYLLPALSVAGVSLASPLIRFHIPLIKPGRRFSRTRLSDKAVLIFCFTRSPTNNRR